MKKTILSSLLSLFAFTLLAQGNLSILFVDDADETFGNAEAFTDAIQTAGYEIDYFDAEGIGESPNFDDLEPYELVIWYTSNDGSNLLLWNGIDTDNEELKSYLSSGGALWLVGLDFLFARYGSPPVSFSEGDFMYDYLGIGNYGVQSFGDDGGIGVPLVYPDTESPLSGLNTLTWVFETLWWVDGVDLNDLAVPVYRMGGDDYVFNEEVCGAWLNNGNHQALTYFFDIAVVQTNELLNENVAAVLGHFESLILSAPEATLSKDILVYPNPASDNFNLDLGDFTGGFIMELYDVSGKEVFQWKVPQTGRFKQFDLPTGLRNGVYLLKLSSGDINLTQRLQIQR